MTSTSTPEVRSDVFILALRQQVVFPAIRSNITIQSSTFAELCEWCDKHDSAHVGVVAVRPPSTGSSSGSSRAGAVKEEPQDAEDMFSVGTYCRIASHSRSTTKVQGQEEVTIVTLAIEGQSRFHVKSYEQTSPRRIATVELLEELEGAESSVQVTALVQSVQQLVVELLKESPSQDRQGGAGAPTGFLRSMFSGGKQRIRWPASPSVLADMIAAGLWQLSLAERQQVLETLDVQRRLELVLDLVRKVVEVHRLSREINSKMQKRTEDELKETVLRRQLHELQREMRKLKSGKGASTEAGAEEGAGDDNAEQEAEEEEEEEEEDDIASLRDALKKAKMSADAQKIAQRELRRLQNIQPHHPEYTVCRTYLETLSGLPWHDQSEDALDLTMARQILEKDHYGLEKVKRRILEFLAVQKMRGDMKGPILCLHGPPGVGKTSLGRSISKALGRKFHRIALGGVRDEAELRGHRRTYIGSMPGAIIQSLISLKVNNPVILLDEIDKLTRNAMFNPSGAMLELLDPEQNHTFKDHYVNTPFDLSRVLFLCTCNDLNSIDRPLLDRMEVIDLSGYTVEEKVHIATTHLLPKQRKLHALERADPEPEQQDAMSDPSSSSTAKPVQPVEAQDEFPELPAEPRLELTREAITDVITKWTTESGVRSLERRLAQICRWAALRIAGEGVTGATFGDERREADRLAEIALKECGPNAQGILSIDARHLPHIVGVEMFEPDLAERLSVGVAMGLGVTQVGGQLLFVEASRNKGKGRLTVTGQLGEVMRESVSTAMSLLRSKLYYAAIAASEGSQAPAPADVAAGATAEVSTSGFEPADPKFLEVFKTLLASQDPTKDPFASDDIHVHFPAGAIPKDGPSAGVTTTLALASLLLGRPVRSDTAVTGEITLRGHVLPVGGIRDKVLAAHRAGVKHVLLPFANQRHVKDDIPAAALGDIQLHYVKHIDEALDWAFAEDESENQKPKELGSPVHETSAPSFALRPARL